MAAVNFSRDVLEMFYGPIEKNQRLIAPISPSISGGFEITRNNLINGFVCGKCRRQRVIKTYSFFSKKQKNLFINVCMNKVETLKSVKIQFGLLVRFYMIRDEEVEEIEHYFNRMQPVILDEHFSNSLITHKVNYKSLHVYHITCLCLDTQ